MKRTFKQMHVGYYVMAAILLAVLAFAVPYLASANEGRGDMMRYNPFAVGSTVEVSMSQNGNVMVRGAKVESKSGNDLVATMSLGPTVLSWTVETDSNTKFLGKSGGNSSLANISNGDYVSFQGKLVSTSTLKVKASVVKNWSIENNKEVKFVGKIQNIDDSAKKFDLVFGNNTSATVSVNASNASLLNLSGDAIVFSTLNNGDVVKVAGTYDANAKVVTSSKVSLTNSKDMSRDYNDDNDDDEDNDDRKDKKEKNNWKNIFGSWVSSFRLGSKD